jgi:NADH-quinone oxidoreductase subunit N
VGGLGALLAHLIFHRAELVGMALSDCYAVTPLDLFFKAILILGALATLLIFSSKRTRGQEFHGEPYLLVLLGLLGASFAASSGELITLFISLEILTFTSYILTAYVKKDKASTEAGLKYLILGGLSSAFFLFGTAILYGVTGSTHLSAIQNAITTNFNPAFWIGFLIVFAGLAFKMGVSPFNFWIPDVYEGAPTWVGGFLSVVSKTTGFLAFSKLLMPFGEALHPPLLTLIAVLSAVTVLYGNLGACLQDNLKRLLGYSSIAQAGYLMLALINPKSFGLKTVVFYLLIYTFSNLLVFFVIFLASSDKGERISIKGLSERSPVLMACLFIGLASLAGVPPTAGFIGKFFLFLSAFQAKAYPFVGIALAGVLISIFYYYRVAKTAFTRNSEKESPIPPLRLSPLAYVTLAFLAAGVLAFGIYPIPILNYLF